MRRLLKAKRFIQITQRIENLSLFSSLVLLPTQLGKHFFLESSFIYSLPVDYLAPAIYLWDLNVLVLATAWIIRSLISSNTKIRLFPFNLLLFFLLSQSTSLINTSNPVAGIYRLYEYFIAGLFGFYLANQNFIEIKNERSLRDKIFFGLSIALWYQAILAIFQVVLGKTIGFWILGERSFSLSTPNIARFNFFGQIFLRAYGTFPHPNVLAAFMVIVMPLLTTLKRTNLNIFLGGIATLLSFSRGGVVVFFIELFFIFKKYPLVFFVFILGLLPFIAVRFISLINFDVISLIQREELINVSLVAFSTSFLNGVGLNNFINFVATSELISGNLRFLQPVHNIFLLTLAETGLVGFLGFLSLVSFPVFYLFKKRKEVFSKTLLFSWLTIFFLGLLDHYFLTLPQGQRLLFLVWGLSFLQISNIKKIV